MSTPHDAPAAPAGATDEIPPLPENATPEEKDLHWFKHVYQGDRMPQLTVRAVLMGGVLGMLMAAANLYTTLSIGWAFGIAITACVLSYVVWSVVRLASAGRVSQMSVLENACMASTASAAGYSTGSTIATMFGALVLLYVIPEGKTAKDVYTWDVTSPWIVGIFTLCTGLMGVFLAIPMKRQMVNHERLPFPTGTAAAATLKSLYSQSAEAMRKAYVLVWGLGAGLLIGFLRAPSDVLDAVGFLKRFFDKIPFLKIPGDIHIPVLSKLYPRSAFPAGFAFEPSALLIAAGMIVGMRISLSLVLSSLLLYAGVGPWLAKQDAAAMERPAVAIMEAARGATAGISEPGAAVDAAVAAVQGAAAKFEINPEPIVAAARGAASGVVKDAPEGTDAATLAKSIGDAAAAAGAGALGKTMLDSGKYKPIFIWDWAGNQVVLMRWALWGGTSVMVFASLASVGLQWRTIARAFAGAKAEAGDHAAGSMARIEVPGKWMIMGMVPITIAMVWLQVQAFQVAWWAGIIAVAMSFVLSMVASRATGETDTTPVGAMGKVMQFLFALLAPGNQGANLASAGIAANSASSSADLLTDLKMGYLLGANPRKQFIAQFCGVFFGTLAIVPIWYLMVPTRAKLETFALPATRAWEAVAKLLTEGVKNLPDSAIWAILIGAGVGVALPVIERLLPSKARAYMPSATGIGLAWVMPFQNAFSFFVGAVIVMIWVRVNRRTADQYNVPLASGLIAGESLILAGLAITATLVGLLGSGGA